jgi:hypothetical protein
MALGRLQAKKVIKTRHPIDLAQGQAQLLGHLPQARLGKVAIEGLQPVQHLDQALRSALLSRHQLADARIGAHPSGPGLGQAPGGDWLAPGRLARSHPIQTSHTPGLAAPFRAQGPSRRQQGANGARGPRRPRLFPSRLFPSRLFTSKLDSRKLPSRKLVSHKPLTRKPFTSKKFTRKPSAPGCPPPQLGQAP